MHVKKAITDRVKKDGIEITDNIAKAIDAETARVVQYIADNTRLIRSKQPRPAFNSVFKEIFKTWSNL
jgi:hypothetical protein